MAGRLTGSLDGRPVVIESDDAGLVLTVATFRTAWGMRRFVGSLLPALGMLHYSGVPVRLSVAGLVTVNLLPRPSALVRFVAPGLAHLV